MENSFCKVPEGVLLFTRATSIVPHMPTTKLERVTSRGRLRKLMDEARVLFFLAYFLLTAYFFKKINSFIILFFEKDSPMGRR